MSETLKPFCDEIYITNPNFRSLPPNLQKSIKKIIEKEKFIKYEVITDGLNTGGDNFMGKLYEIDVKGETNEGEKELNIFIKEPIFLTKQTFTYAPQLFANEEFIYKDFSKVITNLQNQANVPPEDRFKTAKAYDETSNEAIILENLSKRGFRRFDRSQPISLKMMELGVQELARLHGASFVIEKKMPEYFKEKIAALGASYHFDEDWGVLMQKVFKYVANLFDDKTKNRLESLAPVWLEKIPKYHNDKTTKCALCHGDYKNNNVLFRVNDGEPVELIIIDYQAIEYGCPIKDLILFLFYGSTREFRREHMNNLKDLYFETLSRYLQYFEMDVEVELPRQKFEQIYTEWLDYGCLKYLFFAVFMITPDTGLDLSNMTLSEVPYQPDEEQQKLIREMVEDFIDWGYF